MSLSVNFGRLLRFLDFPIAVTLEMSLDVNVPDAIVVDAFSGS